jgi:hypothetical protein
MCPLQRLPEASARLSSKRHARRLLLDLRVNFGNTADRIVVRGLGLHLVP